MKKKLLIFTSILLITVVACTKKPTDSGGANATDPALNKLPSETVAFYTWNTDSEAAHRHKKGPWGDAFRLKWKDRVEKNLSKTLSAPVTEQEVNDFLEKLGLLGVEGRDPEIQKSTVFVTLKDDSIVGGAYALSEKVNLSSKLDLIRKTLPKTFKTKDGKFGSVSGFFIESEDLIPFPLSTAASKEMLALTSDQQVTEQLFTESDASKGVSTRPSYTKLMSALDTTDALSLAFVDIEQLLDVAFKMAARSNSAKRGLDLATLANSIANTPRTAQRVADMQEEFSAITAELEEARAKYLENNPLEAAAIVTRMSTDDIFEMTTLVSVKPPKTDLQKVLLKPFAAKSAAFALNNFPQDVALMINVDGNVFNKALQAFDLIAKKANSKSQDVIPEEHRPLVESVNSFSLVLRTATKSSPFPELMVVGEMPRGKEVKDLIKTESRMAWQQKEVEGAQVDYLMTPFGMTVYLATTKDGIYITNSEAILSDTLSKKAPLIKVIPAEFKRKITTNDNVILTTYAAYDKIISVVESLQSTFAALAGPQDNIFADTGMLDVLKEMGSTTATVCFDGKHLRANSNSFILK